MSGTMRAVVLREAGPPENLKLEERAIPKAEAGKVLIRVEAFGLNRSEMFTRLGMSPDVAFPRILGIEATGTVAEAPGGEFEVGQKVATAMGGMGRSFDGGYAEYTLVPAAQVKAFKTDLPWDKLGALPEMLQTAWGALFRALRLAEGDRLLVRGGTTSVGLAATAIAKSRGFEVAATSRSPENEALVRTSGADRFFLDDGAIADRVRAEWKGGADKVLELIGATTLRDSLLCVREPGVVCMAGIAGNQWQLDAFNPNVFIPTAVALTTYSGGVDDVMATPLQNLIDEVAAGKLYIPIGRTFAMSDIAAAHRMMEDGAAGGKLVVLTR